MLGYLVRATGKETKTASNAGLEAGRAHRQQADHFSFSDWDIRTSASLPMQGLVGTHKDGRGFEIPETPAPPEPTCFPERLYMPLTLICLKMAQFHQIIKGHSLPLTKGSDGNVTTTVTASLHLPGKFGFEGTQNAEQEFHHGIFQSALKF